MSMNGDNVTYFDGFGVEHIPKEIKRFVDKKNITANVYRMQPNVSIMYRYFCISFIHFILKVKSFLMKIKRMIE